MTNLRMKIGRALVRCGLRVTFGARANYSEVRVDVTPAVDDMVLERAYRSFQRGVSGRGYMDREPIEDGLRAVLEQVSR